MTAPLHVSARGAIGAAVLAAAIAATLALGVWGVGHGGNTQLDTPILYAAGGYWLAGGSAYTQNVTPRLSGDIGHTLANYVFAYPPQSAPLFALLAIGSIDTAYTILTILQVLSLAALSYWAVRLAGPDESELRAWIVPALVIGNFATMYAIWQGQTTLIIAAALAGAWYCGRRGHPIAAGVLLAIATMKPPLSLFVVLWFVLERDWKVLAAMTATILVMAALPMYASGPVGAFLEWLDTLRKYGGDAHNALGSRYLFNMESLLWALGVPTPNLLGVGLIATVGLWYRRDAFVADDLLAALVAITMLFGYGHSYDVAVLVLMIPAFWRRVHDDPSASAAALAMLGAICFPNSALAPLGIPFLVHARVAVLCAALVWLLRLSAAARGERQALRAAA